MFVFNVQDIKEIQTATAALMTTEFMTSKSLIYCIVYVAVFRVFWPYSLFFIRKTIKRDCATKFTLITPILHFHLKKIVQLNRNRLFEFVIKLMLTFVWL